MTFKKLDITALRAVRSGRKPSAATIAQEMKLSESSVKKYFSGVLLVPEDRRTAFDTALGTPVDWVAYDQANDIPSDAVRALRIQQQMENMAGLGAGAYGFLREGYRDVITRLENNRARKMRDVTPADFQIDQDFQFHTQDTFDEEQKSADWQQVLLIGGLALGGVVLWKALASE